MDERILAVQRMQDYIEAHLDEKITLSELARAAVFSHGEIIKTGTPKEIFADERTLENTGLDLPVTAFLEKRLKEKGVYIDSDLTIKDFTDKFAEKFAGVKKQ